MLIILKMKKNLHIGSQNERSGFVRFGLTVVMVNFDVVEFVQLDWLYKEQCLILELMLVEIFEWSLFEFKNWYDINIKQVKKIENPIIWINNRTKLENLLYWWRMINDTE